MYERIKYEYFKSSTLRQLYKYVLKGSYRNKVIITITMAMCGVFRVARHTQPRSRVHSCYNNNEIEFNYYQIKNETTKALYLQIYYCVQTPLLSVFSHPQSLLFRRYQQQDALLKYFQRRQAFVCDSGYDAIVQ